MQLCLEKLLHGHTFYTKVSVEGENWNNRVQFPVDIGKRRNNWYSTIAIKSAQSTTFSKIEVLCVNPHVSLVLKWIQRSLSRLPRLSESELGDITVISSGTWNLRAHSPSAKYILEHFRHEKCRMERRKRASLTSRPTNVEIRLRRESPWGSWVS